LTRPAEVFELFNAGLIDANELFGLFLLISPSAVLRECLAPTAETRTKIIKVNTLKFLSLSAYLDFQIPLAQTFDYSLVFVQLKDFCSYKLFPIVYLLKIVTVSPF